MTEASPRRRRKEARPAEVLEAALETFARKGFSATRMDDVAARAGIAKGTIYLYYPSKEALFEAVVREYLVENIARAEAALAHPAPTHAERLRRAVGIMGQVILDPRRAALPKLVLADGGMFPEIARFYRREVVGRGLGLLAGIVRAGIAAGEFRPVDPEAAVRLFVSPILITALWQITFSPVEEHSMPPETLLALHADLFLRGLCVSPPEGDR
ncbi:TetR/AcrR family transcriptional regulator [Pararhodospirillum photometricum]|nr:TetR/AcrR family transcriptional regulator [Pararhodospirillum photometricum]